MSFRGDLYLHLANSPAVAALVGDRVYAPMPESPTRPYVTIHVLNDIPERYQGGHEGLETSRVQIDCWADLPADAEDVADAVWHSLDGFRGDMGTTDVRNFALQDRRQGFAPPTGGEQRATARFTLDFLATYEVAVPVGNR